MLVACTLLLLFQHQVLPDLPSVARNPFSAPADVELGKKMYNGRCAGCHGPTGDGGKGTNLSVPALPRAQTDLALYRIIRYGIPDSEMPSHNMTQREIWQLAAYVRTLGRSGGERAAGNAARGHAILRTKGGCTGCHVVNGEGGLLGPPLTDIGLRRSPSWLRTKLLDPGKELTAGFSSVRLVTRNGRKLEGVKLNEDTWSIQLRDSAGRLHSFWKDDLAELALEQRTPMPSYAKTLTAAEIDDLVAYLASNGVRP